MDHLERCALLDQKPHLARQSSVHADIPLPGQASDSILAVGMKDDPGRREIWDHQQRLLYRQKLRHLVSAMPNRHPALLPVIASHYYHSNPHRARVALTRSVGIDYITHSPRVWYLVKRVKPASGQPFKAGRPYWLASSSCHGDSIAWLGRYVKGVAKRSDLLYSDGVSVRPG